MQFIAQFHERLELLNPHEYEDIEDLRDELIELIDNRIDEQEWLPFVKNEQQFHFVGSKIIVFQTQHMMSEAADLIKVLPLMTRSALFYHMIDAARRTPDHSDDFSEWLSEDRNQYSSLIAEIRKIDPYLISLGELQKKMLELTTEYFL